MDSELRSSAETEVDQLLGNLALFPLKAVQRYGGPSEATLYRARRQGLIKFVNNGRVNFVTRSDLKRMLLTGIGAISFLYGKGGKPQPAKNKKRA
jgi:hypothetical protein